MYLNINVYIITILCIVLLKVNAWLETGHMLGI